MNPFKFGQVVGAKDFCPRPELMKILSECLMAGQNVLLQGERRMGKTSLIAEAVRKNRALRLLHVDLMEVKSMEGLVQRFANSILNLEQSSGMLDKALSALAGLRPVLSTDSITGSMSISLDTSVSLKPSSMEGLLKVVEQMHRRRKLVVFIDEFQDILKLVDHREVLAVLRSRIQFQNDIPYVYAGSVRNQMHGIFYSDNSPFYKAALPLDVGSLDDSLFSRFLSDKFSNGGRIIPSETILRIFELTGRTAGDVQAFCSALWDRSNPGDTLTEGMLPVALEYIFAQESKGYEMTMVQLTGSQIKCLSALARLGGATPYSAEFMKTAGIGTASSVTRALNRLVSLRIIYKGADEFVFSNPFFRHWVVWKNL
jgi:hypothetical protein